jgi:Putative Flp pilus-assembly TadE/G-like
MRDRHRASQRHQGDEGQIFPALIVFGLAILAMSLILFTVGRAADLRARGQTGADAGALAGAINVRNQFIVLLVKSLLTGSPVNLDELNEPLACGFARARAAQNQTAATDCTLDKQAMEITVDVVTFKDLSDQRFIPPARTTRGSATATAKVVVFPEVCGVSGFGIPGAGGIPGLEGESDCDFTGLPDDIPDFSVGDFQDNSFFAVKLIN